MRLIRFFWAIVVVLRWVAQSRAERAKREGGPQKVEACGRNLGPCPYGVSLSNGLSFTTFAPSHYFTSTSATVHATWSWPS